MTFRIAGLALALCCLLALPAPPPAHAARGMEVAVQDDSLLLFNPGAYMGLNKAYRRLRAMKTSRTRMNLLWGYVVTASQRNLPTKPRDVVYDWAFYDRAIRRARRRGIKVQLTLTGPAPAWATPTRSVDTGYITPNVRLFKKFVKKVAHRYRRKVDRFAIWNEPNWYKWLGPLRKSPRLYRKLYIAGYKAIKRKAPRARVLLGETSPNYQPGIAIAPLKFLRGMTCLNRRYRRKPGARRRCKHPLRADGVAHHPYDFDKSPRTKPKYRDDVTIAVLGRLNRALRKMKRRRVLIPRRSRRMPVHLTEYGYFKSGRRKVRERRRARWTVKAWKIARRTPHVKTMLHYVFVTPPGGTNFDLALLKTNGNSTRTYRKLKRWTHRAARRHQIKRPGRWRAG